MREILPEKDFKYLSEMYEQTRKFRDTRDQLAETSAILKLYPQADLNESCKVYNKYLLDSLFYQGYDNDTHPLFECLLKRGLKPYLNNNNIQDPIFTAVGHNYPKLTKLFLDYGADPNKFYNMNYRTPLFVAVTQNHKDITKILLRYGANPNTRVVCPHSVEANNKPLWYDFFVDTYMNKKHEKWTIGFRDATATMKLLLKHGMDLTIKNPFTQENFFEAVDNNKTHEDYEKIKKFSVALKNIKQIEK